MTNTHMPGEVSDHLLDFLQSLSLNRKLAAVATIEEQDAVVRSMDAETLSLARISDSLLDALRCLSAMRAAEARGDYVMAVQRRDGFRMFLRLADDQLGERKRALLHRHRRPVSGQLPPAYSR